MGKYYVNRSQSNWSFEIIILTILPFKNLSVSWNSKGWLTLLKVSLFQSKLSSRRFSKKTHKWHLTLLFKSKKANLFVCFFGESTAWQFAFEINLPLKVAKSQNAFLATTHFHKLSKWTKLLFSNSYVLCFRGYDRITDLKDLNCTTWVCTF